MTVSTFNTEFGIFDLPRDDHQGKTFENLGHYEGGFINRILADTPRGGTAIDVGACFGAHSIPYAGHFDHVYAIEPNPIVLPFLERNANQNGCENISVMPIAVLDRRGTAYTDTPDMTNLGHTVISHTHGMSAIDVATIDELDLPGPVRLIKIDAEGKEAAVIRGAARTILKHRPVLFVEWSGAWTGIFDHFLRGLEYRQAHRLSKNILFIP